MVLGKWKHHPEEQRSCWLGASLAGPVFHGFWLKQELLGATPLLGQRQGGVPGKVGEGLKVPFENRASVKPWEWCTSWNLFLVVALTGNEIVITLLHFSSCS